MGALTLVLVIAGGFLAGLVAVAALVAGWEMIHQREQLDAMRRDRAVYAATSPLPLAPASATAATTPMARPLGTPPALISPTPRRDPNWIETRPMVLCAPAVDDETRRAREAAPEADRSKEAVREPDLLLD